MDPVSEPIIGNGLKPFGDCGFGSAPVPMYETSLTVGNRLEVAALARSLPMYEISIMVENRLEVAIR